MLEWQGLKLLGVVIKQWPQATKVCFPVWTFLLLLKTESGFIYLPRGHRNLIKNGIVVTTKSSS